MNDHPLRSALLELFHTLDTTGSTPDVRAAAVKLSKRKDLKDALAPIAAHFKFPLTCQRYNDTVVDDTGAVLCTFTLEGDPYRRQAVRVPGEDTFVLAGADPACPVVVVRPYAPDRPAVAPEAPPEPLTWAVPGTTLTYEIADFDVEDRWSFDVLAADEGLTLRVRTGEADVVVAAALACTAEAVAKAIRPIAFSQEGADVAVDQPQSKQLPPLLVSRGTHGKLAAGREAPFHSEWSEKVLLTASRGRASLRVNEREVAVATLKAEDADGRVAMTILDDPRWPLVIDRTEGDCSVRLVGITTGAVPVAAPAAAAPEPGASHSTRRYEFTEGSGGKFWEISHDAARLTVRFGKLGTIGQVQVKDLGTEADATREREKIEREKTKKGYARA